MTMRFVDAFAGVGGFHLGVKKAVHTAECVMAIEWDKHCKAVYLDNLKLKDDRMESDISTLDVKSIPEHDLLCGGFPCPSFSQAGKTHTANGGEVKNDGRAYLFLHLCRILEAKQPSYCIFENVPGIQRTKHDGGTFDEYVVEVMNAVGYTVTTDIVANTDVGIPQDRKRVYFVGIRKDLNRKFVFPPQLWTEISYPALVDVMQKAKVGEYNLGKQWAGRKCKRLPFKSRYEALSAAYKASDKPTKRVNWCKCVAEVKGDTPSGASRQGERVYSSLGWAPTLTATVRVAVEDKANDLLRYLTPRECARLQGFPDSFRLHKDDRTACKQMGNAVCVDVVAALVNELVSPTDWDNFNAEAAAVLERVNREIAEHSISAAA